MSSHCSEAIYVDENRGYVIRLQSAGYTVRALRYMPGINSASEGI
jgi:hypothetical protein